MSVTLPDSGERVQGGSAERPDSPNGGSRIRFRPDIEGLRAVAILLVVLDHLKVPGFQAGFIGVDIFFVISGFLITSLLAVEQRKKLGRASKRGDQNYLSIADFYKRRARRILPASLTVIAVTLIASKLLFNDLRFAEVQADAFWATIFAANLHLMDQATDYFAVGAAVSPLQNYWSLAVEEQFYLVWPALMIGITWLSLRIGRRAPAQAKVDARRHGSSKMADRWQRLGFCAIGLIAIGSLAWSIIDTSSNATNAYYSPFTRAYELAIGAMVAMAWWLRESVGIGRRSAAAVGLGGAGLIAISMFAIDPRSSFPGWLALMPTVGTALLIVSGMNHEAAVPTQRMLSAKPMRFVGKISYSLYLWHWPIIVFASTLVSESAFGGPGRKLTLFAISLAVAWLSYLAVEQPFRTLSRSAVTATFGRARSESGKSLRVAMMGIGAAFVALTVVALARPLPRAVESLQTADQNFIEWATWTGEGGSGSEDSNSSANILGPEWAKKIVESVGRTTATAAELREIRNADQQIVRGCFDILDQGESKACSVQGSGRPLKGLPSPAKVLLIGDSFAAQWRERLAAQLPKTATVVPVTLSFCFVAPGPGNSDIKNDPLGTSCAAHRPFVNDSIRTVRPDLIVVSTNTKPTARSMKKLIGSFRQAAPTIWIGFPAHAPKLDTCLGKDSDIGKCNGPLWEDLTLNQAYAGAARSARVPYLNLIPLLCSQGVCPAFIDGGLVRPDGIHLSKRLLDLLSPLLRDKIAEALKSR